MTEPPLKSRNQLAESGIQRPRRTPDSKPVGSFVQTERKAHEAWAKLTLQNSRAAVLLHFLVSQMNERGALIASQQTISAMLGQSIATTKRALQVLEDGNWIQKIRVGSERGGVLGYVVNSRVAWADKRSALRYAMFDATVLVSSEDDDVERIKAPLQQIPSLFAGEQQLPAGEGEAPPSQPLLDGIEPDLPALNKRKRSAK